MTAEECRRRREAQGLTTGRLAAIAGLVESTVLNFEAGKVASRYSTVLALKRGLERAERGVAAESRRTSAGPR